MLKMKLQNFSHLMQRVDSLEKTLMLGKTEGRKRRRQQKMRCWKSRDTWSNRPVWPWSKNWSRSKANRVLQREHIVRSKTFFQKHKKWLYMCTSPDDQYQNQIDYNLCGRRWRSSIQSEKHDLVLTVIVKDGETLRAMSVESQRVRLWESGLVTEQQPQYNVRFCFIFEYIHLEQYYIRIFNKHGEFHRDRGISTWNSSLSSLPSPPPRFCFQHRALRSSEGVSISPPSSPVWALGALGATATALALTPGPTWWNAWGFLDSTPPTSPPSIYQPPGLLTDLLTYQTHTLSKAPKDFLLAPNSLSQTYTWLPLAPPSGLCSTFSKHSIWPFLKGQPGLSCALPSLLIWIWYFPSKF